MTGVQTCALPIYSVQGLFYDNFNKLSNSFQFITNISKIKKEDEELRKTNSKLQNKAIQYNASIKENERLRSMFKFSNKRDEFNYIGADIIGLIGNSYTDGFETNTGEGKGIKKGMIAMTGEGLVGQVTLVGNNRSIVQLLSNENIAVAALVESTRDNGIVKGDKDKDNKSLAKIQHISLDSHIKKDDVIVTSGLGGIYPAGIKIGSVISVHADKSRLMKSAIIKPYVDLENIEEVFIVAPKQN